MGQVQEDKEEFSRARVQTTGLQREEKEEKLPNAESSWKNKWARGSYPTCLKDPLGAGARGPSLLTKDTATTHIH